VLTGGYTIVGFRNHDITAQLYVSPPHGDTELRRRCAPTSWLIAKLRGHQLVAKVPRARLYRVTPYGQRVLSGAIAYHDDLLPTAYLAATS
jgi:hypothetical protein